MMTQKQLEAKGVEFTDFMEVDWIETKIYSGPHKKDRKVRRKVEGFAREATISFGAVKHIVRSKGTDKIEVNNKLLPRCEEIIQG